SARRRTISRARPSEKRASGASAGSGGGGRSARHEAPSIAASNPASATHARTGADRRMRYLLGCSSRLLPETQQLSCTILGALCLSQQTPPRNEKARQRGSGAQASRQASGPAAEKWRKSEPGRSVPGSRPSSVVGGGAGGGMSGPMPFAP